MNAVTPVVGVLLANHLSIYWHLPFLLVVVSLVYSATRHDEWPNIFRETGRWILRMAGFLLIVAGALWLMSVWI